jgi:hypothetical protein
MEITGHDIGTVERIMHYLPFGTAVTILKSSWQPYEIRTKISQNTAIQVYLAK